MTPNEIALIRESWAAVTPIADAAVQLFYQRLFEIDPSTRQLFEGTDMPEQRRKLIAALSGVVQNAHRVESLLPMLSQLGRRHVDYGVEGRHYDSVGSALLWTLERGLGSAFTPETAAAWRTAYGLVAGAMRAGAEDAAAA